MRLVYDFLFKTLLQWWNLLMAHYIGRSVIMFFLLDIIVGLFIRSYHADDD